MKIQTECDNYKILVTLSKKDVLPLKEHEKRNLEKIREFSKEKNMEYGT
jgi:hypothetical protein